MRKLWTNLLRIALSLVALALLWREIGGGKVMRGVQHADLRLLGAACLLFLGGIVVRAFRWRALLHGLGVRPPLWLLLKLYLVGSFFNTFLPSGFGGDVVRVVELARGDRQSAAVGTVFVDRLTGILSLMALGLVVLPFTTGLASWLVWTFVLIAVGGLSAGFVLLEGRLLPTLAGHLPPAFALTGQGKLAQVYAAVAGCGAKALWQALALSTLFNLINIAVYWLCGLAVGIAVDLSFYFVLVPLLSLTLLIPISVGGLGARDWVAQPLFGSVGVLGDLAAAMTLSVFVVSAAVGLVGGLVYLGQGVAGLLPAHGSNSTTAR